MKSTTQTTNRLQHWSRYKNRGPSYKPSDTQSVLSKANLDKLDGNNGTLIRKYSSFNSLQAKEEAEAFTQMQ